MASTMRPDSEAVLRTTWEYQRKPLFGLWVQELGYDVGVASSSVTP
jgi:hypothetical protein